MASALAAELGVRKVVVPRGASVFSAWGMMMSDLRRDYFVTRLADLQRQGAAAGIEAVFAETEARARAQFAAEGVEAGKVRVPALRQVPLPEPGARDRGRWSPAARSPTSGCAEIEAAFHETYEREYTYRLDAPVEMVGIHLVASAEVGKLDHAQARGDRRQGSRPPCKGRPRRRLCARRHPRGRRSTTATKLEPGMTFTGPAIVEDPGSTIVVHPGNKVSSRRLRQHPYRI